MVITKTTLRICASLWIGLFASHAGTATQAQDLGPSGSLGGYGGSAGALLDDMAMSTPALPYAGRFGGFMPARMGGGSLSFQTRGASSLGSLRAPFTLAPRTSGMSSMSLAAPAGMGAGMLAPSSLSGPSAMSPGLMSRPMPGSGVMPPNFGYPFYQPPSFVAPAARTGMSM